MPHRKKDSQAERDQAAHADRVEVRDEATAVRRQAEQERIQVRRAAAATGDQAHNDMQAQLDEMRKSNPFSVKNIVAGLLGLFGCWMAAQIWGQLQIGQKATEDSISALAVKVQVDSDMLLVHGYMLTNVMQSVARLEQSCMTKDAVDGEIFKWCPEASPHSHQTDVHGATKLMEAVTNTTNFP